MPTSPHVLRFPPTGAGFEEGSARLRDVLDAQGIDGGPRFNLELAFEEVATNIVRHASSSEDIKVTVVRDGDEVVLTFEDNGAPFDPRERPDPVPPSSIDEATVGGLGLMLVKRISTRLSYTRTPERRNQLTLAIAAR